MQFADSDKIVFTYLTLFVFLQPKVNSNARTFTNKLHLFQQQTNRNILQQFRKICYLLTTQNRLEIPAFHNNYRYLTNQRDFEYIFGLTAKYAICTHAK